MNWNQTVRGAVNRPSRRAGVGAGLLLGLLAFPAVAGATLGEQADSVQADKARMNSSLTTSRLSTQAASYTVHELRAPTGVVVREYVSPAGTVFAVVWTGPFRPDLHALLGSYFDPMQQALQAAIATRRGRGPVSVEQPGLVVHMGGHQRAFFGSAYVPALLPPGFPAGGLK